MLKEVYKKMHPDDKITFTIKDAVWDKEMLKTFVKDKEWETYDESTATVAMGHWSYSYPKISYNISEKILEEAIDNIKVLLHAAIDVKIDLNELKEIVREGFFAALKEEEKSSAKMYI